MADLVITAANVVLVSGPTATKDAAETVSVGDWVYDASSTTVGVATNADEAKDTVSGMALNAATTGQPVTYAKDGAVVALGSILTVGAWYVLSAAGATSPVADQATNDYVTGVGYGSTASNLTLVITNTGLQAA